MDQKEYNHENVIKSLANRNASLSIECAQKDAAIIALSQQIKELEMENKQLHEVKKAEKKVVHK